MEAPHGPKRFSSRKMRSDPQLTREILEVRGYTSSKRPTEKRRSRFARVTSEPSISRLPDVIMLEAAFTWHDDVRLELRWMVPT